MKKTILFLVLILLVSTVNADILNINSGGSNELIIMPMTAGEIGFFNQVPRVIIIEEEEPIGGGGSGDVTYELIGATPEGVCPEGKQLWNGNCYNCTGQLAQVGNEIVCVVCPKGTIFDGKECIGFEMDVPSAFYLILAFMMAGGVIIIFSLRRDKKEKAKQEKMIEERKNKIKERRVI